MNFDLSTRTRIAVSLLVVSALLSSLIMLAGEGREYLLGRNKDSVIWHERRLEGIRKLLPARGVIGYITDQDNDVSDKEYLLTQYCLAPVIIVRDPSRSLVIGNFEHPESARYDKEKTRVLKETGSGILLLERSEEK